MIKRINHIKSFGVFKNYQRDGTIQVFAKLNIIYGWNYSGKTLISRIFQCFENKELDSNYTDSEFELEDYEKNKYTQNNLDQNTLQFKVFNSDFIRDNIHLEGEPFDPVLLLGKESKDALEKIKNKTKNLQKVRKVIARHKKAIDEINSDLSEGLRKTAARIKEKLEIVQAFDKRHIENLISLKIRNRYKTYILKPEKVKKLLSLAIASKKDKLDKIDEFTPSISIVEKLDDATELLAKTPEFSKIIDYCQNEISEERSQELLAQFYEEFRIHKRLIVDLKTEIEEIKISEPTDEKSEFYSEFWGKYDSLKKVIQTAFKQYNTQLDKLITLVQQKHDSPFSPITDFSTIDTNLSDLKSATSDFNDLVSDHNKRSKEFEENKASAIEQLKKHYGAVFISKFQPDKKEELIVWHSHRMETFDSKDASLVAEISSLEASISKAQIGAEQLNIFIEKFLGRKEIKVVIVKDGENERFKLERDSKKAVNLSEGEKKAIAFSFFLAKLKECKDLSQVIVFIDYPV